MDQPDELEPMIIAMLAEVDAHVAAGRWRVRPSPPGDDQWPYLTLGAVMTFFLSEVGHPHLIKVMESESIAESMFFLANITHQSRFSPAQVANQWRKAMFALESKWSTGLRHGRVGGWFQIGFLFMRRHRTEDIVLLAQAGEAYARMMQVNGGITDFPDSISARQTQKPMMVSPVRPSDGKRRLRSHAKALQTKVRDGTLTMDEAIAAAWSALSAGELSADELVEFLIRLG